MSLQNNIRAGLAGALLMTLAATACGTASASPEKARDVTGRVDEPRIYPPTDIPEKVVPPRIYPPTEIPATDVGE